MLIYRNNVKGRSLLQYFIFLSCLLSIASISAEQNSNPGINRPYQNAEYEDWVGVFESRGREVYEKRHEVVRELNIRPGMDIADVGAGTGFYSLIFAQQVGKTGKVYAVDIAEDFIRNIEQRAEQQGLHNIIGIISEQKDTRLAVKSVDLVFVCATYHHFEYPQSMLASIWRALRPGGELVVIDFRKQHGVSSSWVMSHVRNNKQAAIQEIEQAGFKLEADSDLLKSNYFLRFVKKQVDE